VKAKELAELLLTHPDWDVGFKDCHYGGMFCEVRPEDIIAPPSPDWNHPEKTWLIRSPDCGPDPDAEY
jgi:hypothetical protein